MKNKNNIINFEEHFYEKRIIKQKKDIINSFIGECPNCFGSGALDDADGGCLLKADGTVFACDICSGTGYLYYPSDTARGK